MKAQSRPTLVVHEPLPNKTIWSFQGLTDSDIQVFDLLHCSSCKYIVFLVCHNDIVIISQYMALNQYQVIIEGLSDAFSDF